MDCMRITTPSFNGEEEWIENLLARQRLLFQEQLDTHYVAVAKALDETCNRLEHKIAKAATVGHRVSSHSSHGRTSHSLRRSGTSDSRVCERPSETSQTPSTTARKGKMGHRTSSVRALVYEHKAEDLSNVARCIRGPFQDFVGICIVLNTVTMFAETQWLGSEANASLGMDSSAWVSAETAFYIVECFFCIVFTLELCLNLCVFRLSYFKSSFNILDSAIVLVTTLELFVLAPLAYHMPNLSFVRLLRLAKIARALKVVRTMSYFGSLRVLISTMIYSMTSLGWSMAIMFLLMLMCSIFLCQALHDFVIDETNDLSTRSWVNNMYGSGLKSLYTVFEMTFSGCWPNYARRVIEEVSPLYAIFFVAYVALVIFAMIRVISALFLKETLAQASHDTEMMVRERQKKSEQLQKELETLFEAADTSHDGVVTVEEWEALLSHPKVLLWLRELGIDAGDTQMLFDLLDDGDGNITKEEFVSGVSKMKGEARAQDIVPLVANCQRILALCKHTRHICDQMAAIMAENAEDGSFEERQEDVTI